MSKELFEFLLRMGDNTLVLGQRVSEWCGVAPVIEEDIALANMALDLIGQTQLWLGHAAEVDVHDAGIGGFVGTRPGANPDRVPVRFPAPGKLTDPEPIDLRRAGENQDLDRQRAHGMPSLRSSGPS